MALGMWGEEDGQESPQSSQIWLFTGGDRLLQPNSTWANSRLWSQYSGVGHGERHGGGTAVIRWSGKDSFRKWLLSWHRRKGAGQQTARGRRSRVYVRQPVWVRVKRCFCGQSVRHEGEKDWNSEQPCLGLWETDTQGLLASLVEHGLTRKIIQGCIS